MPRSRTLLVAGVLLALTACTGLPGLGPTIPAQSASGDLTIFAAASLSDAFSEIGNGFEQDHPGTRVTFNYGGSSQLRAQMEQGASADVFASADERQMTEAVRAGLAQAPVVFARNTLTIIVPAQNPRGITGLRDLARPGVRIVAAQPGVPIGQYTNALVARAAADPAYGPEFRDGFERNVVSREDNVRQVVGKIRLGEADAAIVYSSDVTPAARPQLMTIAVPEAFNVTAAYPMAATSRSANGTAAQQFVDFVLSRQGQAILAKWGFLPANPV